VAGRGFWSFVPIVLIPAVCFMLMLTSPLIAASSVRQPSVTVDRW
jgi:hypothetical protein